MTTNWLCKPRERANRPYSGDVRLRNLELKKEVCLIRLYRKIQALADLYLEGTGSDEAPPQRIRRPSWTVDLAVSQHRSRVYRPKGLLQKPNPKIVQNPME